MRRLLILTLVSGTVACSDGREPFAESFDPAFEVQASAVPPLSFADDLVRAKVVDSGRLETGAAVVYSVNDETIFTAEKTCTERPDGTRVCEWTGPEMAELLSGAVAYVLPDRREVLTIRFDGEVTDVRLGEQIHVIRTDGDHFWAEVRNDNTDVRKFVVVSSAGTIVGERYQRRLR